MIKRLFRTSLISRFNPLKLTAYKFCSSNQDPKFSEEVLNKLKNQAQQFYENIIVEESKPFVELEDATHFNSLIQQSDQKLIIVYVYASWSPECKLFKQTLYQALEKYADISTIVNVDIDKHSNIVTQLQISSVPFAGIVYNNQFVDGYFKNQKNDKFMSVVESLARILRGEEIGEIMIEEMNKLFAMNNFQGLLELTQSGLANKTVQKYHSQYYLYQILAYLKQENMTQAKELLDSFEKQYKDDLVDVNINSLYSSVQEFYKEQKELQGISPEIKSLFDKLSSDPQNKDLQYEIAEQAITGKNYELAINTLLDLIKKDKTWSERKAQKRLVDLFAQLGNQNSLVADGRKKLAKLLY